MTPLPDPTPTEILDPRRLRRMLDGAIQQIRAHHEMLGRLDGATGDGDHGVTILRAMETVGRTMTELSTDDLGQLLSAIAWAVMACDGGSTGPLLGTWFSGMGDAATGKHHLDAPGLVALFDAGIAKLQKQSRAQVGDKTMMDAFLPALQAMKAAPPGTPPATLLSLAAAAAAQGAEATANMRAKFGRARNLGDRVLGHRDPGAVSVSLLFKGFAEALAQP